MTAPMLNEERLNILPEDMQFAVFRHDGVHSAMSDALRDGDHTAALTQLHELCDITDTTRLRFVFGESNLHQEIIATAQQLANRLGDTAPSRFTSAVETITRQRMQMIEELEAKPVRNAIYIGTVAVNT